MVNHLLAAVACPDVVAIGPGELFELRYGQWEELGHMRSKGRTRTLSAEMIVLVLPL